MGALGEMLSQTMLVLDRLHVGSSRLLDCRGSGGKVEMDLVCTGDKSKIFEGEQ